MLYLYLGVWICIWLQNTVKNIYELKIQWLYNFLYRHDKLRNGSISNQVLDVIRD